MTTPGGPPDTDEPWFVPVLALDDIQHGDGSEDDADDPDELLRRAGGELRREQRLEVARPKSRCPVGWPPPPVRWRSA